MPPVVVSVAELAWAAPPAEVFAAAAPSVVVLLLPVLVSAALSLCALCPPQAPTLDADPNTARICFRNAVYFVAGTRVVCVELEVHAKSALASWQF